MDKKIGLEHTIRNVVRESIGGPNTDKFKGTPKAFLQPAPHIEPKVGDSHPDGSSVTAKRGVAKIAQSETMKEEEELSEAGGVNLKNKTNQKKTQPNSDGDQGSITAIPGGALGWYAQRAADKAKAFGRIFTSNLGGDLIKGASDYVGKKISGDAVEKGTSPNMAAAYAAKKMPELEKLKSEIGKQDKITQGYRTFEPRVAGLADLATAATMVGGSELAGMGKPAAAAGEVVSGTSKVGKAVSTEKIISAKPETPVTTKQISATPGQTNLNKTISNIMKRPDLGDVANVNKPKPVETPSVANVKPEKVEPLPKTGNKGKKPEAETAEPQTQGNLALKPKEIETPSAPVEKPLKFDKPGQDVVPVEKPTSTKPYKPKTMTPDEIAKEMDKFKRQQAPVAEPPSKKSIDTKEFFGKPAPASIKPPANANVKQPAKATPAAQPAVAPAPAPATKSAPAAVPSPATAPAAAPQTANAPAVAPATAPATKLAPAPAAQTAAQPAQKKKPEEGKKEEEGKRRRKFSFPTLTIDSTPLSGPSASVSVSPYLHYASNRRGDVDARVVHESASEERSKVENVARPTSKDRQKTLNTQQQIKQKIIDENAKKVDVIRKVIADKKSSTVNLNPKLKHQELDQN